MHSSEKSGLKEEESIFINVEIVFMAGIDSRVAGVVHSLPPQAEEMFSGVGFSFARRFLWSIVLVAGGWWEGLFFLVGNLAWM